ncbi:MAG: SusC/RagA family TonB-linked outer membrane protein [Paludibacter sp.]|nr:SusC/RagA family TonB-linked outer membrane protein [Paludibacter sp.]
MKNHLSWQKLVQVFLTILFVFVTVAQSLAANITVKGTVVDEQGIALPGVNIKAMAYEIGVITDFDGKYTVQLPLEATALIFSYIGYTSQQITINKRTTINIVMLQDVKAIEEVVVIGYGKTTKKELTGSISSLKAENFSQGSFANAAGLLQGKVAGLSVVNANGGDPQANYEIILRGTNTLTSGQGPLIIIDGVAGADMKNINFQEVESVDVLKDGSAAAIYGTRGTNGVIIITTKQARKGKTNIEYQGIATVQIASRMVQNLSAEAFKYAIDTYTPAKAGSIYNSSTNWFNEVTRSAPISQKHNLAISGGNDEFSHRTTINMEQNQGLLKNNNLSKLLAKTNILQKALNGLITLNYNSYYSMRKYNPANYDIFFQAFIHNPTEPVYDNTNELSGGYTKVDGISYYNPVAMLNEETREGETDNFGGNVRATLNFPYVAGLKWDNFVSYEKSRWESHRYRTRYYPSAIGSNGIASIENGSNATLQYESTVNYTKEWEKNTIQALAGYTYQTENMHTASMENRGFDFDYFGTNDIDDGAALKLGTANMDSYRESSKLISFFGRAIYNFGEKYLFSASIRREGSSRFGVNYKWGWFPAVSVGWRIHEEDFMNDIKWLNELKLRIGYGSTGNQEFSNYKSLIMMGKAGMFYYNGKWINTYQPVSNPNPNLRWEKKHEVNLGVDFSGFQNKIGGSIDIYNRRSKDLLYNYDVSSPPYLFTNIMTNVGIIRNTGIEISLNGNPIKAKDLKWNTFVNFSTNKNILEKFTNDEFTNGTYKTGWLTGDIAVFSQRMVEGKSLGTFYGPVWLRVDENGNDIFKNQLPDGKVAEDKWEPIGNAYPAFILGWSNAINYKSWDLGVSLRASIGGKVLNSYRLYYENFGAIGLKNILKSQLDNAAFKGNALYSSKYIEDASYLKMDNLSVGYNWSKPSKLVSSIRIYSAAQDLFCITAYKGVNPEVSLSGLEPGIEKMRYYPVTTGVTIGVNIIF